ncbi:MAG: TRAP transporter substrate-binding protein [Spirochaetaceae bacterium]|jgi:tripartite ATP-independent transporter DctP family solute receptor|nr:TRAP transporter substrate-binding protein [Spirochaetaceae bacterium]
MSLKKIGVGFVVVLLAAGVVFGGGTRATGGGGEQKITLKVGDTWSATHPIAQAIDQVFKPQVESKTNGAVTVEVYHSGVLGAEQVLWDGVRNGTIEIVVVGSVMNTEYTQMLISDWPFLYRDLDHAKKVWTGSFATDFIKDFDARFPEVRMLSVGPNSARTFTSNKKLTSVDDFRGQKFRMPSNPIHVGIATDLGASAQVIPLNELFNALQTGVVDGQDNGMVTVLSEHLNEVQKYLYETNHIVATMEIIINAGVYNALPAETQKIISDAAKEAAVWAWDTYIKSVDADRETIKAGGVTVTPVTAADQERIINAIQPTLNKLYAENSWARTLTDKVKAVR